MPSIEDIILDNDRRGVAALRALLPADFCDQAARSVMSDSGTAFITTGFYVYTAGAPETDGPPGALAIGRALEALGRQVVYISDLYGLPVLHPFVKDDIQLIEFPIADDDESRRFASELLARHQPSLLISIERCGLTRASTYLNMQAVDISAYTARIDYMFLQHSHAIGIGDGGNEIGMGNLAGLIPQVATLPSEPCTTGATHLVISSTSNWGGYGLVAALSRLTGRNLLPRVEDETELICRMVDLGAVDGVTGDSRYSVDSMNLEEHGRALSRLHNLLTHERVSP